MHELSIFEQHQLSMLGQTFDGRTEETDEQRRDRLTAEIEKAEQALAALADDLAQTNERIKLARLQAQPPAPPAPEVEP